MTADDDLSAASISDFNPEEDDDNAIPYFSKTKTKPRANSKKYLKQKDLPHKCPKCNQSFKSIQGVHFHYTSIHDKSLHLRLPYKCDICKRGFKSLQGLKHHKPTHGKRISYKCTVCSSTQLKEDLLLKHIMTHASDSCFPCQVCGKIYKTNEERMKHWETHANEKPYSCEVCYRRFRKQQYLTSHLKTHFQYQCHLCNSVFVSSQQQISPFVCTQCENLPNRKDNVNDLPSTDGVTLYY